MKLIHLMTNYFSWRRIARQPDVDGYGRQQPDGCHGRTARTRIRTHGSGHDGRSHGRSHVRPRRSQRRQRRRWRRNAAQDAHIVHGGTAPLQLLIMNSYYELWMNWWFNLIVQAQYMQQQSQIFVFSTNLANKAAETVLQGQFQTIIAFHCSQPGTKKFLEVIATTTTALKLLWK